MRCTRTPRAKSFQSTLPARGATTFASQRVQAASYFNPRSPHGERPCTLADVVRGTAISIHAPRTGSDGPPGRTTALRSDFNPRSPHGERRRFQICSPPLGAISIHAPRTGSDAERQSTAYPQTIISIHAPRTGSDLAIATGQKVTVAISIHAPRTGSDRQTRKRFFLASRFQSTLPARGATQPHGANAPQFGISIHAPRTGSDERPQPADAHGSHFNPRSPHGERPAASQPPARASNFNPRSPHGERLLEEATLNAKQISIHAPRTGSDLRRVPGGFCRAADFNPRSPHGERRRKHPPWQRTRYFNPRSPHGERPDKRCNQLRKRKFQSTLPARGATRHVLSARHVKKISIHAPRTGSDFRHRVRATQYLISIHAPRTGSDGQARDEHSRKHKFQSTLPARGATRLSSGRTTTPLYFNPRSPHGERLAAEAATVRPY